MDLRARPYRSVLYIPGSRDRALEKARDLAVDAIIFDLEDAVTAEEKPNARALLAQVLAQGRLWRAGADRTHQLHGHALGRG